MNLKNDKKLWLLPVLVSLTGCGDVLFAEIEQPEVCKQIGEQAYSGSEYSKTLSVNLAEQLPGLDVTSPNGIESVFNLTRVEFTAKTGITNFDFVDNAKITLLPPDGSDLARVDVIDFTRTEATTAVLNMTGSNAVDLFQYLTAGVVNVEAALTGRLPETDWSMDVKTCLYAKVRGDYVALSDTFLNPPAADPQPDPAPAP